jgi:hypothetical protein
MSTAGTSAPIGATRMSTTTHASHRAQRLATSPSATPAPIGGPR